MRPKDASHKPPRLDILTWDCAAAGKSGNCILAAAAVVGLEAFVADAAWGTRWGHPRSGRIPGPVVRVPHYRFAEGEAAS